MSMFRRMRLMIGLWVTWLCLSMAWAASAATVAPIPEDRVSLGSVTGLSMTHHYDDQTGLLDLQVQVAATDWQKVLTYAQVDNEGMVSVPLELLAPANAVRYMTAEGVFMDDDHMLEVLEYDSPRWLTDAGLHRGSDLALYEPARSLIVPMKDEEPFMLCVRWFDSGDAEICTEKLLFTVTPSSHDALSVPMPVPDPGCLVTDLDPSPAITAVTAEGNTLTCIVDSDSYAGNIRIGVRMPVGATQVRCVSGNLDFSNPIQNGCAVLSLFYDPTCLTSRRQVLEWLDANDSLVETTSLFLILRPKTIHPWPFYVAEWQGIPKGRLVVDNPASSFIDARYEDKQDHMLSITYSGKNPSAEPSQSNFSISVRAPEGAVAYRTSTCSGDSIMGWNQENFFWQDGFIRYECPLQALTQPNEVVPLADWPLFSTFRFANPDFQSQMTAFLPQHSWKNELGGEVSIIYWYDCLDPDAEPFLCEYACNRIEPFVITAQEPALRSPVDHRLTLPVILVDAHEARRLTLVIGMYPQCGIRAIRYELHLEDEQGMEVMPPRGSFLFLPYPDGCFFGDSTRFTLFHYDESGHSVRITPEKTPYGLRFQSDTLSPFVLSWDASSPSDVPASSVPSAPPKTGDSFPLSLLWGSLLLSACLSGLSLRRRKKG